MMADLQHIAVQHGTKGQHLYFCRFFRITAEEIGGILISEF